MEQLMSKLTIPASGDAMPAADHVNTAALPSRGFLRGLAALPLAGGTLSLAGRPSAAAATFLLAPPAVAPAIAGQLVDDDSVLDARLFDLVNQWRIAARRDALAFAEEEAAGKRM